MGYTAGKFGHFDATLWVKNVFDERGELGRFSQCNDFNFYCNDHARVYPIKPQLFGIKFGQNF